MPTRSTNFRPSSWSRLVFLLALAMFATERQAMAYTDPGTGALIWQMALAGLAAVAFYFRRITSWFKNRRGPKGE